MNKQLQARIQKQIACIEINDARLSDVIKWCPICQCDMHPYIKLHIHQVIGLHKRGVIHITRYVQDVVECEHCHKIIEVTYRKEGYLNGKQVENSPLAKDEFITLLRGNSHV